MINVLLYLMINYTNCYDLWQYNSTQICTVGPCAWDGGGTCHGKEDMHTTLMKVANPSPLGKGTIGMKTYNTFINCQGNFRP